MSPYEENIEKMSERSNEHYDKNLAYILSAYQQAKLFKQQFANVEIVNTYLLQEKQFEQIAEATYNYLHASSIFYIISAQKLKQSTSFLEQQYNTAQDNLASTKSYLLTAVKLHKENE